MRRFSYKEVVRDVKGVIGKREENRWMVHKSEHDHRRRRNVNYFLFQPPPQQNTTTIIFVHHKIHISNTNIAQKLVKKFGIYSYYYFLFLKKSRKVNVGNKRKKRKSDGNKKDTSNCIRYAKIAQLSWSKKLNDVCCDVNLQPNSI